MGNRHHGLAGGKGLQRQLNLFFRLGIKRGSGFVEKKNGRILQDRPRNGDPLLLTAGKQHPFVADNGVVLVRLLQDELMCVSHLGRLINVLACRVQPAKEDIVVDGIVKQKRVLSHQSDLLAQRLLG